MDPIQERRSTHVKRLLAKIYPHYSESEINDAANWQAEFGQRAPHKDKHCTHMVCGKHHITPIDFLTHCMHHESGQLTPDQRNVVYLEEYRRDLAHLKDEEDWLYKNMREYIK
jgi:hypothetical protein